MKMSLRFDDEIKSHLKLLISTPSQVLVDFCRLALDYIKNGPNDKRYQVAAQKLNTSPEDIENGVTALVKLLIDSCKHSLKREEFEETVAGLGWGAEQRDVLVQCYEARRPQLQEALAALPDCPPAYGDLHWRLQTQVASRCSSGQACPRVVLELQLRGSPAPAAALQTDLPNLVNLTAHLETALRESKTFHIRRMQRVLDQ